MMPSQFFRDSSLIPFKRRFVGSDGVSVPGRRACAHWASWGEWTNLFSVHEYGSTHEVKHIGIQPQMVVTGYGDSGEITFHAVGHEGAGFASWSSTISNAPSGSGSTYILPISSNTPPGIYIVTGHGVHGCDHVATVVVVRVEFKEDPNQNYGFDTNGAWVSVETCKTTTVKVDISPATASSQVYFTSSDPSKVAIFPTQACASPQTITLTAGATQDDSATIYAHLGSSMGIVCEQLHVAVYNRAVVTTYVHAVNGFTGLMPFAGANEILKQAVVQIENVGFHNCTHDLSAGYANDVDEDYAEHEGLLNQCHMAIGSTHLQDVYMICTPGKIRLVGGEIRMGAHYSDTFAGIGTLHWNIISQEASPRDRYLAHEVFHTWADHLNLDGNLMHENEMSMGNALRKGQWDLAH